MKITDIKPYPMWAGGRNVMLVKVETDEGVYGWGEAGVSSRELAVVGAVRHYREFLIGMDPMNAGALWQLMYRSQYFEGGRILTGALSAIDIALHDIKGKALGVPVYQLLGGRHRDFVPGFATTSQGDKDASLAEAKAFVEDGWQCIRLNWQWLTNSDERVFEPRESIAETAEWLIEAREALDDRIVLGIDYHHRLSVAEAASFCQKMPSGTLDFLEEPIRDESPAAYRALRSMTDVPFAIGEEISSKWHFVPYIEEGLTQYARLDICNIGGFTEAMKVAGWCEAHYIDLMPHNPLGPVCTAASVHLGAAVPNFSWLESRVAADGADLFDDEMFPVRPHTEHGRYPVPTSPGLGVEVNEEALKAYEFRFWEAPHLRRKDGSLTNW